MTRRTVLAVGLGAAALLVGLAVVVAVSQPGPKDDVLAGKVGRQCTVQFRRGDGLGSGATLPVPPTSGGINGAAVCVHGKLTAVGGGWVVVTTGDAEYCVPREAVLMLEFHK